MRSRSIAAGRQAFAVKPFRPLKVGLVQTVLPGIKDSVLAKTVKVTEARLARSGSRITAERRTGHDEAEVAEALDIAGPRQRHGRDVRGLRDERSRTTSSRPRSGSPAARSSAPACRSIRAISSSSASYAGKPVLGAPGCARSPKENGFDWVLDRLIAGIDVTRRRHCRPRGRRPADGNPDAAAAARERARSRAPCGSMPSCWPPAARAAWAAPTS